MTAASRIKNIYHCCVHKTGSQWLKAIFSDEIVSDKTGMSLYTYQKNLATKGDPRKLSERIFDKPFPENCIISPLYMDYSCYTSIPKPDCYKTFFIFRDPRDIIVSWYFSVKYSHPLMGKIPAHRATLQKLSLRDGLIYCIEYLHDFGLFTALESWINVPEDDPPVMIIRFEDLVDVSKQSSFFSDLFSHCGIRFSKKETEKLLHKYRFGRLQKKSKKEQVSHYRRGVPGDWQEHFDEKVLDSFNKLTKDLISKLGYGT